ncbi:MAG: M16 family metallopeptidase [Coriobacteriales bacterium]
MPFEKSVLDNGVTVVTEHMGGVRSAALGLWVRTGSRDEEPQMGGISHFMEHMLFKGTPTRSALEISAAFDALGAEANAFTTKEQTCFYARMMDENLDPCFQILADMLVNASFEPMAAQPEREVVIEEIARSEDTPDDYVFDIFSAAALPECALGRPILGTRATVAGFGQEELRAYHSANYVGGNVTVACCGNVSHAQVAQLAQEYLGGLRPGPRRVRPALRHAAPLRLSALEKDSEQAHVVLGCPAVSQTDPRRHAYALVDAALGGSMSSRLFTEVREKRGLAYSVFSTSQLYEDCGQFMVYAGTRPDKLAQLLQLLRQELQRMAQGGITEDELHRVREMVCGSYVLSQESPRSHMLRLGKMACSGMELYELDETLHSYRAVTLEQVNQAAFELLSQEMTAAVISPCPVQEVEGMVG